MVPHLKLSVASIYADVTLDKESRSGKGVCGPDFLNMVNIHTEQ